MKLTSLWIENFLGARHISVKLTKRVSLFAGTNAAGKSSVQEAIRMALTSETVRVGLKKEYGALVTDGAEDGFIDVGVDDAHAVITLPGGKRNDYAAPAALPYVLDAQRFSRMEPNDRRTFLFGLMGVQITPDTVSERLKKRGCNMEKVQRVAPLLRAGFDAACKEAKSKATEAKGAWRAITGETYGSVKAAHWAAMIPIFDRDALAIGLARIGKLDAEIAAANQQLGALRADAKRRDEQQARVAGLTEKAAKLERIKAKLVRDEAEMATWAEKLKGSEKEAAKPAPAVLHCPCCAEKLTLVNGVLWKHDTLKPADDLFAAPSDANLSIYRESHKLMVSAVANGKRDLADAEHAAADLKTITEAGAAAPDAGAIDAAQTKVSTLTTERASLAAKVDALRVVKAQADAASKKTTDAACHHDDVTAWDAIADALAPDGIPGEMLGEALGPINARLAQSANDAEWPRIEIGADMSIHAALHERPYALLSESEKWRADAMVAEAVSHLSGTKLLVLDRFDVLDMQGRADLLAWLDILADGGEIDSCLLFGTLKALPSQLPATIEAFWIEAGVVGELKEAA